MALTRGAAVEVLHNRTALPMSTILGTFAILDKGKLPLTACNLAAASFTAFKAYETCIDETIPFFLDKMVPFLRQLLDVGQDTFAAFKQAEMTVLQSVSFGVPSRTRVDKVEALMRQLGVPMDVPYNHAAILALLVPNIHTVSDDLYARTVLCAASLIMPVAAPAGWLCKLPTATISRDSIMCWALRVADVAGPPEKQPCGTKRQREG